jgi:hypothetical protein
VYLQQDGIGASGCPTRHHYRLNEMNGQGYAFDTGNLHR